MLNNKGFDLWAGGYNQSVNLCEEADEYPFAGYREVLNRIYKTIHTKQHAAVLDIGFGTGVLTKRLYDDGYSIYGIDFSARMIEIAREKMPDADLMQYDFANGLPEEFSSGQFDAVVSTYAFHHLTDPAKIGFITQLLQNIPADGMILIGDVMFRTRGELIKCRTQSGDHWDSDEIYTVFDELKRHFEKITFSPVSFCAGIITVKK